MFMNISKSSFYEGFFIPLPLENDPAEVGD
jgi:hypothetical protein